LGGSFNPAHRGHLHVSEAALKALRLDYVWWLVSPQNPLKSRADMAGLSERLAKARRSVRHPRIVVTAIEAESGTRFTADTLAFLLKRFPQVRFVWLMGSDNLVQIPRWRRWRDIFQSCPLAVVTRPGTVLKAGLGRAANCFAEERCPPDRVFASRRAPAWTMIEAHRELESATHIRDELVNWRLP
jgi:nicotinate-nucleotide adenylyltransferase